MSSDAKGFEDLPDDCLLQIFQYLDAESINSVMATSRRNYNVLNESSEYIRKRSITLQVSDYHHSLERFNVLKNSKRKFGHAKLEFSGRSFSYFYITFSPLDFFYDLFERISDELRGITIDGDIKDLNTFLSLLLDTPKLESLEICGRISSDDQTGFDIKFPTIKMLKINHQILFTSNSEISFLLDCCNSLTHLEFGGAMRYEVNWIWGPIRDNNLNNITQVNLDQLIKLKSLNTLKFEYLKIKSCARSEDDLQDVCQLTDLHLHSIECVDPASAANFTKFIKAQNSISKFYFKTFEKQKEMSNELILHLVQVSTLKSAEIWSSDIVPYLCDKVVQNPNVEKFQIQHGNENIGFVQLSTIFPNLKEINLPTNLNFADLNRFTNIEKLRAHGHEKEFMDIIHLPNLLEFSYKNDEFQIKPASFCSFLQRHQKLESLKILDINGRKFEKSDVNLFVHELRNLKKLEFKISAFKSLEIRKEFVRCIGSKDQQLKELRMEFSNVGEKKFADRYFQILIPNVKFYSELPYHVQDFLQHKIAKTY